VSSLSPLLSLSSVLIAGIGSWQAALRISNSWWLLLIVPVLACVAAAGVAAIVMSLSHAPVEVLMLGSFIPQFAYGIIVGGISAAIGRSRRRKERRG